MPSSSLKNFHCIFCGHYFYEQKAFERHQVIEHNDPDRNEDGYLGDGESEGDAEAERTHKQKSYHSFINVMFPIP